MSDFDVVPDAMKIRELSDADIEALVGGAFVPDIPAPLTDLLVLLRQRADSAPTVSVSGALSEFIVGHDPASLSATTADAGRTAAAATRRPAGLLAKAVALLGLIPTYAFIGATAAAALVGGAQVSGVIDVPLLPDSRGRIEAPSTSETSAAMRSTTALTTTTTSTTTATTTTTTTTATPTTLLDGASTIGKGHTASPSTDTSIPHQPPHQSPQLTERRSTDPQPAPTVPVLPHQADASATAVGCPPFESPGVTSTTRVRVPTSPPTNSCDPAAPSASTPAEPPEPPRPAASITPPTPPSIPALQPGGSQPLPHHPTQRLPGP